MKLFMAAAVDIFLGYLSFKMLYVHVCGAGVFDFVFPLFGQIVVLKSSQFWKHIALFWMEVPEFA